MAWSEAVGPDGHVTALEFEPAYAKLAEEAWAKNGIKNTEVIVGDAAESLKKLATELTEPYDLIFIDADKVSYPNYLELILSKSKPGSEKRILGKGGIIIADNILRRGLIADSSDANPWSKNLDRNGGLWKAGTLWWWQIDQLADFFPPGDMEAIDVFNKKLVEEKRLETFLMPLYDGLGMAKLLD